jgi:glutaminase
MAAAPMNYQDLLEEIRREVRPHFGKGKVADYIPALARVPPDKFGMALVTVEDEEYVVGDGDEPFSIQSISKLFTLMLTMSMVGDEIWTRCGKEPSGTAFNSLVLLEHEAGVPRNPFVNAGALVVVDCMMGHAKDARRTLRDYIRVLAQNFAIEADPCVARSEKSTGFLNAALANFLKAHGRLDSNVERVLDTYYYQCALAMSCRDLARAALPLAHRGVSPLLQEAVLTERQAKRINAMTTERKDVWDPP